MGYGLYDDCLDNGVECVILAPTKIARSVEDWKRKRDDRDATRIFEALRAHVLAGNELPAIWIPDRRPEMIGRRCVRGSICRRS